ncbi:DUF1844 domain-containing protein [candidate division KSB1 bacterium]|nr:MAG: DUF1844 domain-containing protein [candidate division KSB1 bacterium]
MEQDKKDFYDSLFLTLILNFQSSAMIGMGKILNPVTNKITKNMNEAKLSIDMLEMLSVMTKGNLKEDLSKLLQKVLTELRLNYVDELEKDKKEKEKDTKKNNEDKKSK